MSIWHAVYLEKNPAQESDIPNALFANEGDALDWAYEKALESVDIVAVHIPQMTRYNPPESHRVNLSLKKVSH